MKNIAIGIIVFFFCFSVKADRILLVCEMPTVSIKFSDFLNSIGHKVTVLTEVPDTLRREEFDQFWITLYGKGNSGNYEPRQHTQEYMREFMKRGGKVALFCDHSSDGFWVDADSAAINMASFVNSVLPPGTAGDFFIEKIGFDDKITVVDLEAAMLTAPSEAEEFASQDYDVYWPGFVHETNLAGGYGVLKLQNAPWRFIGIGFNHGNLHYTYRRGRMFVFTDLGNALSSLYNGNTPILKFIAAMITGNTTAVHIVPTAIREDTTVFEGDIQNPPVTNHNKTSLKIILDNPVSDSDGTVEYAILPLTARFPEDYDQCSLTGTLTFRFDEMDTVLEIPLRVIDDNLYEKEEQFQVLLYNASDNIYLGGDTLVEQISIIDDDPQNSTPTDIVISTSDFPEEGGAYYVVGTISTVDPTPSHDTHTYTLWDTTTGQFVTGNADFYLQDSTLITKRNFDYETDAHSFRISLRSEDSFGEFIEKEVTFTLLPLNDNEPDITSDTSVVAFGKVNTFFIGSVIDNDIPKLSVLLDTTIGTDPHTGVVISPYCSQIFTASGGSFSYKPDINTTALLDSFQYQLLDSVPYDSSNVYRNKAWKYILLDHSTKSNPIAVDDSFFIDEDGYVTGSVMLNDLKASVGGVVNSGPLLDSVRLVEAPKLHKGKFQLYRNGVFTYYHTDVEEFNDMFTYELVDKAGAVSAVGVAHISIAMKNDKLPIVQFDTLYIKEGDTKTCQILNEFDSDEDLFTKLRADAIPFVQPNEGTVTIATDGVVTYAHSGNDSSLVDSFAVSVSDSVLYDPLITHAAINWVYVYISPVNDNPPIAHNDTLHVLEGRSASLCLDSLIDDVDGGPLSVSLNTNAIPIGLITLDNTTDVYFSHSGIEQFEGQFTYTVSDSIDDWGNSFSSTGTIFVTVQPLNDQRASAPEAQFSLKENATIDTFLYVGSIIDGDRHPLYEDFPFGSSFRYLVDTVPVSGTLTLQGDGSFTYTHMGIGTETVKDSFYFRIVDSTVYDTTTHISDPVKVLLHITDVNDESPEAKSDTILVAEGESQSKLSTGEVSVLANDRDIDNGTIITAHLKDSVYHGRLELMNDGTFLYEHDGLPNYCDSFTYIAHDGIHLSEPATVLIIVEEKPPVVQEAYYYDHDGNGEIDNIEILFNRPVDTSSITFQPAWQLPFSEILITGVRQTNSGKIVQLDVSSANMLRTSGELFLDINHVMPHMGTVTRREKVMDRAAPVLTGAIYDGSRLEVSTSEPIVVLSQNPFTLFPMGNHLSHQLMLDSLIEQNGCNTIYSYNGLIAQGDSMNCTINVGVADTFGNIQTIKENLRQPIFIKNGVLTAAYHDTSYPADGIIDKITVQCRFPILQEFTSTLKSHIVLPQHRKLTIDTVRVSKDGMVLEVTQLESKKMTTTLASDQLLIPTTLTNGSQSLDSVTVSIEDSLPPVILYGEVYQQDSHQILSVIFSEPVALHDERVNPYSFWDYSGDSLFTLQLSKPVAYSTEQTILKYILREKRSHFITSQDSLAIGKPGILQDKKGVNGRETIWAPVVSTLPPDYKVDFFIFPQPITIVDNGNAPVIAQAFDPDFITTYRLHEYSLESRGIAFVLELSGTVKVNGDHKGKVLLLDCVGNEIAQLPAMTFVEKSDGTIAGISIWNGRNGLLRSVGRGTLSAVVIYEVDVETGKGSSLVTGQVTKSLGVKK